MRLRLLIALAAIACAPPPPAEPTTLHVIGTDYAFAAPDTVPAGIAMVTFENKGVHSHELIMSPLKDGLSARQFADSIAKGVSFRNLRRGGSAVLFADSAVNNQVVSMRLTLKSGELWGMLCQFADSAKAPKHHTLGMFRVVAVK